MSEKTTLAVLAPNRSLDHRGFFILMAIISGISFISGVVFISVGAWPIVGFFGLDVLLIYWAFKVNYRSGGLREIIELDDETLKITRISPAGQAKTWQFNRYWVRVQHSFDPEEEYDNQPLILTSHGRMLEIAGFLSPDEKIEFSEFLRKALKA